MSIIDEIEEATKREQDEADRAFDHLRDWADSHPRRAIARAFRAFACLYGFGLQAEVRTHEPGEGTD